MTAQVVDSEKIRRKNEAIQDGRKVETKPQEHESQPDLDPGVGEVTDFMEGLDVPTPSEKVSEKISEDDKKQQGSKSKKAQSDDDVSFSGIAPLEIPSQRIMVRRIRKELHKEIKALMKQAKREEKKGAFYLTEVLEKIRNLQGVLYGLATATFEAIRGLYVSLFDKKEKNSK